MCLRACVCVCACVRACVCVCVRARARAHVFVLAGVVPCELRHTVARHGNVTCDSPSIVLCGSRPTSRIPCMLCASLEGLLQSSPNECRVLVHCCEMRVSWVFFFFFFFLRPT